MKIIDLFSFFVRRAGFGRFRSEVFGNVAVGFSLALIPVMLTVGAAIDYSRMTALSSQAQPAADAAALAGVRAAINTLQGGGAVAAATTAGNTAAQTIFNSNLAGATIVAFDPGASVTASGATYSPTATVSTPTSFVGLAGLPAMSVRVGATAHSSIGKQYIDIYVLVDASQSMGIGASATDQANMIADSKIGCMLACHNGHTNKSSYFDAVAYARTKGYQLRFDVVRSALNTIAAQAQTTMASTGAVIRFGIYSFATNFKTEVDITSTYGTKTTAGSILHAINNMDIADNDAGTSHKYALDQLKAKIGAVGDGSSASKPQVFVLLMTDGVGNANDNQAPSAAQLANNEAYNWTYSSTFYPAFSTTTCWATLPPGNGSAVVPPTSAPINPPCIPDPWVAPSHTGNFQMELNGVDPAWCTAIKNLGATLMTLNTTYVIGNDPTDWRTAYIQQKLIPSIPTNLQSCASSSAEAFVANSATQVQTAIGDMFNHATKQVSPVILTR
jgi:Flp pilus assembly protein TadG